MADYRQFGMLGLLAAVLLALGLGAREYLRRADSSRVKRHFIEHLVEESLKAQQDHLDA